VVGAEQQQHVDQPAGTRDRVVKKEFKHFSAVVITLYALSLCVIEKNKCVKTTTYAFF
jgi:hypothetical protein